MSNYPAGVTDSDIDALWMPDPYAEGMGEMTCESERDECIDPETTEPWSGQAYISEYHMGRGVDLREWTCPRCKFEHSEEFSD